ncbi:DNA-directed RNA polymerase subunit alpha [soil metagenome]
MFSISLEEQTNTYGKFVYEPLHASFGNSIGNAMRRTLLSSLPGAAIGYIKFQKAPHFFTTIPGIKESVLDIVLNLKQVRFAATGEGPFQFNLAVKGGQKVYAKDIQGEVEVVNGDLYIAQITDDKASLDFDGYVEVGYGYQSCEDKEAKTGYTTIDSAFSPVVKVNFKVEEARVGRTSNFDRLIMEVWTDGSISPAEAVKQASMTLTKHFQGIHEGKGKQIEETSSSSSADADAVNPKVYETIIDELNLPSRVINALLRENIETVADLVERGKEDLTNLKGVGKKSIDLIVEELKKMDVELK